MTQTPPISAEQVEAAARAMCVEGGFDPDEIMANDGRRWRYYAPGAVAALTAAASIPASREVETEEAWRFEIQYGPEGEANYAWVYDETGKMVGTMQTYQAKKIAGGMNTLKAIGSWSEGGENAHMLASMAREAIVSLAAPQPVQEQEPVAWIVDHPEGKLISSFITMIPSVAADHERVGYRITKLYASPPEQELTAKVERLEAEDADTPFNVFTTNALHEQETDALNAKVERLTEALNFVWRWTWYKEGNGTSDAERLDVIKHHPTIAALGDAP